MVSSRYARYSSQYRHSVLSENPPRYQHHLALQAHELFDGEAELDESYFGGVRKGKRGRGAAGKTAVLGILKRNGKVYTVVVQDTKTKTLLPVTKKTIQPDSIVYTDCYRSYDVLDISEFTHYRINHNTHFAERKNHQWD